MPGEGFMQSMRVSLKNNGNLLKGRRKGFFKRELSYAEIRKYYKESTDPISNEKGSNAVELQKIRERLIRERKRFAYVQISFFIVVAVVVTYGVVSFLTQSSI